MIPLPALPILSAIAGLASVVLPQADQRAQLLESPEYVEAAPQAAFREVSADELRASLKVVGSRSFAVFGFNTPELQLHLPLLDNSSYAAIEMPEPRLLDAGGNEVIYELERGLHDAEIQVAEIRFLADGGDAPAEYARAAGEIHLRYPSSVTTRSVAAGGSDAVVRIDGPFVEILEGPGLAEAAPFSALQPVRAFDAEGRQLARAPYSSSRFDGGVSWQRLAFKGPIARVEVDSVASWVEVEIRYDVPIAPLLPQSRIGQAPADERAVAAPAGSRVDVEVRAAPVPAPAASPATDPDGAVPIPPRDALSETARALAGGIDALKAALPGPPAIVQLLMFPRPMVSISVETDAGVREWTWTDEGVSEPRDVDTRWLDCKQGMSSDALTLQRLPALWDDAVRRIGAGPPLQTVVGQYPCGVPYINVPFDGGRRVQYEGDGRFVKVE